MSNLISDNLFLVLLIFGGALVSIRGYELYSKPPPRKDPLWLVNEMDLRHLTGSRQFVSGFLFYLIPVLLIYLLLSVSPELLNLTMGMAGTTNSVGALTIAGPNTQIFAPILAATAVITLFSVKPFSKLEQAIRRLSHGIAGIPQYIQDIIRELRQMSFQSISPDSPIPRMQLDHVKEIPGLDNDLVAIGNLHDWIFGSTGALVWSDQADQILQKVTQPILGEYSALKRKLALSHPSLNETSTVGQPLTDESLEQIVLQAREMRIKLTRLLAVLIANQDEPVLEQSVPKRLQDLIADAQRKRAGSRQLNVLAASTMIGVVISFIFGTLFNLSVTLFHELSIANAALSSQNNELYLSGLRAYEFYWSTLTYAAKLAWLDVFGISLIFFTGCSAALVYRSARLSNAAWGLWHARHYPVIQYVVVALIACISAGLAYELYLFTILVVVPSLNVNNAGHFASMLQDFGSDFAEFGLLALLAIPSAVMVCRISDYLSSTGYVQRRRSDSWALKLAWTVGLVSLILYLFIRLWIGEIHELSAVLISALVPSGVLYIMTLTYWHIGDTRPANTGTPNYQLNELTETRPIAGSVQEVTQDTKVRDAVT